MSQFQQDWRHFHGDAPPLGFVLRKAGKPWVRFHSLPESKRYAETPEEHAIILKRTNTLAASVLQNDQLWLVQLGDINLGWEEGALKPRREFDLQYVGDYRHDDVDWPTYAGLTTFALGRFNELISDIADDRAFKTLWMSSSSGRIVAPYDGGTDVLLESDSAAQTLKARFRDWRPMQGDL